MRAIEDIVKRIVEYHRTNNPFRIARQRGIIINFTKLKGVLGYHQTYRRISVICIHEELSDPEKRFVCAHELGHAVLHPKVNTPFLRRNTLISIGRIERQANLFAVQLLVSGETPEESETIESFYHRHDVPVEIMGKI